jgi:hypothetical protein
MATNADELEILYKKILGLEMISRMKICGVRWDRTAPNQFMTSFDEDSHFWKAHLTNTGSNIILDFKRDAILYYSITSEIEPSIEELYKELDFNSSAMEAIIDFQNAETIRCGEN